MFLMYLTIFIFSFDSLASPAEEYNQPSALDSSQSFVTSTLNSLANGIDSFFATDRADDEFGRSRLRISQSYSIREKAIPVAQMRYRLNLKLPHLEDKFKFEYFTENKKSQEKLMGSHQIRKKNHVQKGWILNADAGVSVALPPNLIIRTRLRRNFEQSIFIHRFVESMTYVTDQTGLIEETILQSDLKLSEHLLFRFSNIKIWEIQNEKFTTKHGPAFIHALTGRDAISYDFSITNQMIDGAFFTSAYTFALNYRRNIHKNWAFLDFIPGLDFPKVWSFRRTPFALVKIEILFGG